MRWPAFILVSYFAIGLQLGLNGVLGLGAWMPSLPLIIVLFVALHAPAKAALLGAALVGVGHDAIASVPFGTYTFSYGIVALASLQLRQVMYREHPFTHGTLALLMGLLLAVLFAVGNFVRARLTPAGELIFAPSFLGTVATSITTAMLAVPMIWALRKVRQMFAFGGSGE
jgi:rod shape-determining protein MreD